MMKYIVTTIRYPKATQPGLSSFTVGPVPDEEAGKIADQVKDYYENLGFEVFQVVA